ncbi:MAG: hypothetical protein GC179_28375 [Anaerolineaceae bacterium]|nr:hypothetical protein [Anaerolineaceae bacterium]
MKHLLVLGIMMVFIFGMVSAHDSTATPTAPAKSYVVNLSTEPKVIEANKPFTLTAAILMPDGQTPVTAFDEVHTKLLHFILVSEDLTQFLHVHPDYQGGGIFVLKDVVLPTAADYVTFADFTPTGEEQHFVRNILSVEGATHEHPNLVVGSEEVTIGDLKMHLVNSAPLAAGGETHLQFHATSATTASDVENLDEYLGAAGHLVIIDQTSQTYIHTHPAGHDMESMSGMNGMSGMATSTPAMAGMEMPMQYGPDLDFMAEFPSAGLWAMWLQVQYKGDVYTFPFVVEVTDNVEATPETHAHG